MTRSDDEQLRDALRAGAGSVEPPADGFDAVRRSAQTRARRRRWQVGVAAGSIAAVAAAVVGVVAMQDDDPSGLELTPPAASSSSTTEAPTTTTEAPSTTLAPTTTVPPVTTGTLPPAEGFAGVTDWQAAELGTLGAPYADSAASPQAKVDALVDFLKNEPIEGNRDALGVVTGVLGNRAQVEVRVIGFPDDSVGGRDFRLYLLQEQPGDPWIVVAAETRDYCVRGFDGSFCV